MAKYVIRKIYYIRIGKARLYVGETREVRDTEAYTRLARFMVCATLFGDCQGEYEVVRTANATKEAPPEIADKVMELFGDDERIAMFRKGHLKFT